MKIFEILTTEQLAILLTVLIIDFVLLIWAFVEILRKPKKKTVWIVPPAADVRLSLDWEKEERENEL
jgi:hypothetical protein